MSELNESQRKIAETLDGIIVVDAGPGTGKTHTIVERFVNLISRDDVSPKDVLLLTFTRNAASEMEERIKGRMASSGMISDSKLVQVKTFDSFCMAVVMEAPELAGSLFGIDEKLSHSVTLVENETLNRGYFRAFLDEFLEARGSDYGDWGAIASQSPYDLYALINRLMSRGIFPMRHGWYGNENDELLGDRVQLLKNMRDLNELEGRSKSSPMAKVLAKADQNTFDPLPEEREDEILKDTTLRSAAEEDRTGLLAFVHDVYWQYIRRSISEDRLTFGINAMLAFSILYSSEKVRSMNSYRYVMIDEFQDTNASQLMMALMIMKEPNLCVVGDWKQGIYGFRFVSVENILDFDNRAAMLRRRLNEDTVRIRFSLPQARMLPLTENYRSSQTIVDGAFRCLTIHGSKDESLDTAYIESRLVRLTAHRQDEIGVDTGIRYVVADSQDDEAVQVARCIRDYVGSDCYPVVENGVRRPMRLGDIAVLCRNGRSCRSVMTALEKEGIPAFLQGDIEVMSTREGKLVLAWLRYISNPRDLWGLVPIMADLGYPMTDILEVRDHPERIPKEISDEFDFLRKKRRRVTDLISSIFAWYGLDNDITQTIITVLSSAHRNSLLTLSDLIAIIEEDIRSGTTYPVELEVGGDAVTVMTMHKSKGLEFPTVVIPYMDLRVMPAVGTSKGLFIYSPLLGVRCSRTVGDFDGYRKICGSWRTALVKAADPWNYDEERRLMFVAMSRAKQYETLICGDRESSFMKELREGADCELPEVEVSFEDDADVLIEPPDITGYTLRTPTVGVHSVMKIEPEDGQGGMSDTDEAGGKGTEYGKAVHDEAEHMYYGMEPSGDYPESEYVRRVLDRQSMEGFVLSDSEVDCTLPVESKGFILKGIIDLMLVFGDRIEIHDYKTDSTDRFQSEYELQLSIYAQAAAQFYGKPARCFIDYVSQGRTVEFEPMTMDRIAEITGPRYEEYRKKQTNP